MKAPTFFYRLVVLTVLLVSPLPAIFLYNAAPVWEMDPIMGLGMVLGLGAFSLVLNQILLASKPFGIDKKAGQPWYQAVHGISGLAIVPLAIVHRIIKMDYLGYPDMDQTAWGLAGLAIISTAGLLALVFMQPGFLSRISILKNLRQTLAKKHGLAYPRFRMAHAFAIVAPVLLSIHVFLASSSSMSPAGWWYFMGYFALALVSYLVYRLKDRYKKTAPN